MICDYNKNHVCVRCGVVTSYPKSVRRCCLPGECEAFKSAFPVLASSFNQHGPGTELKSLLAGWPFRIVATPDCKCTSRASYMDAKGCDWCESPEGMAEILGFLREAAEERGLPFLDAAGRLLVKRAIHNARKAEAERGRKAAGPPLHP